MKKIILIVILCVLAVSIYAAQPIKSVNPGVLTKNEKMLLDRIYTLEKRIDNCQKKCKYQQKKNQKSDTNIVTKVTIKK